MNKENIKKMVIGFWLVTSILFMTAIILLVILAIKVDHRMKIERNECMEEVEMIGSVIEDKDALIDRMIIEKEKCERSYIDNINGGM